MVASRRRRTSTAPAISARSSTSTSTGSWSATAPSGDDFEPDASGVGGLALGPRIASSAASARRPRSPLEDRGHHVGRGDKRTAKGKRFKHSFGVSRPKNAKGKTKKTGTKPTAAPAKKPTGRK